MLKSSHKSKQNFWKHPNIKIQQLKAEGKTPFKKPIAVFQKIYRLCNFPSLSFADPLNSNVHLRPNAPIKVIFNCCNATISTKSHHSLTRTVEEQNLRPNAQLNVLSNCYRRLKSHHLRKMTLLWTKTAEHWNIKTLFDDYLRRSFLSWALLLFVVKHPHGISICESSTVRLAVSE